MISKNKNDYKIKKKKTEKTPKNEKKKKCEN